MNSDFLESPVRAFGAILFVAFAVACKEERATPTPVVESAADAAGVEPADPHGMAHGKSPHAPATDGKPALPPAEIEWTKPAAWKEMPARMMRKATYEASGDAGPAELAIFYFGPGQGGSVEENVQRWIGQFQGLPAGKAVRDQMEVNGLHVFTVRVLEGTFASGMPGAPAEPKESWGMNAAIVETPSGAYYFKMTGPAATVTAEEGRFSELLESVRTK